MKDTHIRRLRNKLLETRRAVLDNLGRVNEESAQLEEPQTEVEESAQNLRMESTLNRLDERDMGHLELIDLALAKISVGAYGVCEICGESIGVPRLDAVPEARACIHCAERLESREEEPPPAPSRIFESLGFESDYEGLPDETVASEVADRLRQDERIDGQELWVRVSGGVVYLDGVLPSEDEKEIAQKLLTDIMGVRAVVDHTTVDRVAWERRDRTSGRREARPGVRSVVYSRGDPLGHVVESEKVDPEDREEPPGRPIPKPVKPPR